MPEYSCANNQINEILLVLRKAHFALAYHFFLPWSQGKPFFLLNFFYTIYLFNFIHCSFLMLLNLYKKSTIQEATFSFPYITNLYLSVSTYTIQAYFSLSMIYYKHI